MRKLILTILFLLLAVNGWGQPRLIDNNFKTVIGEDKDEVVICENDLPQVKFYRWNKENYLTIRYSKDNFSKPTLVDGKVKVKNGKEEILFYEGDNPNEFKFVLVLKEKPSTNKFTYYLEGWEDFDFLYQPPISVDNPTGARWMTMPDNKKIWHIERPENVVGSYAVYHKTKVNNQYKTGKFCHIYRPRFIDADNKEVWADLYIENGVYTITIPQDFLDTAKYPIRANDICGVTSQGGTNSGNLSSSYTKGCMITGTMPATGTPTEVHFWMSNFGYSSTYYVNYYNDDSTYPDAKRAASDATRTFTQASFVDETFELTGQEEASGAQLHTALVHNSLVGFSYDASGHFWHSDVYQTTSIITPFPDGMDDVTWKISTYIVYTPSGAAPARRVIFIQ